MDKENLSAIRAEWIAYLIDTRFNGDKEKFCEQVVYKVGTINHFLCPTSQKSCGSHAARTIERKLDLEPKTLDTPRTEKKQIYYVAISTNAKYTYEIVTQLQKEKNVMECSAVLGDFDILIKVEVESFKFLDMLLAKLVKFPGVKRSQTYKSIDSLHWQRKQKEQLEIPKKDDRLYIHNGISRFIYKKIEHLYNEVKLLKKETIIVKDSDLIGVENYQILEGTKKSICAIRVFDSYMKTFEEFLKAEKKLIEENNIDSRRIIILSKNKVHRYKTKGWSEVQDLYEKYERIGSKVRFLYDDQWISSGREIGLKKFIILDDEFVCIREEEKTAYEDDDNGQMIIIRNNEVIQMYMDTFNTNWSKSITYSQLYSKLFPSIKL